VSERDVTLRDGRTLHVYDDGDPDGLVVVEHHGTPGSGLTYPPDLELARERGLRVIAYDRAGYGLSTPNPGRVVADISHDIEDVLDALDIERCVSLGGSGGAPHSLALGARLADRCVAVGAIACPTPWDSEGVDQMAGMGEQNVAEFNAALEGPEALEAFLSPWRPRSGRHRRRHCATSSSRSCRRSTARCSRATAPRTRRRASTGRSHPGSTAGATTTSRS
jgi:pimeloyl-ACP methyl ester carboxylesterase